MKISLHVWYVLLFTCTLEIIMLLFRCVLLGKKKFAFRQAGALKVSAGWLNPTGSYSATGRTDFKVGTSRFCMQQ